MFADERATLGLTIIKRDIDIVHKYLYDMNNGMNKIDKCGAQSWRGRDDTHDR